MHRELSSVPVLAEERWLHQVVTNLPTSALKFTPAEGSVTICTRRGGHDGVLEVIGTGIGDPGR